MSLIQPLDLVVIGLMRLHAHWVLVYQRFQRRLHCLVLELFPIEVLEESMALYRIPVSIGPQPFVWLEPQKAADQIL